MRENTSIKNVECLTKEEEVLFEVIQMAIEEGVFDSSYMYLGDDGNFTKKFVTFYEVLKNTIINLLDESSYIHFIQDLYTFSVALENYVSYRTYEDLGTYESTLRYYFDQLSTLGMVVGMSISFGEDCDIYDIINDTFALIRENEYTKA